VRPGFTFTTALADGTPVHVAAAFDHEETVYIEHAWLRRDDGTDGPDFLDILSHDAHFGLLSEAASRCDKEAR
jgi:hypothetical protein